LISAAAFLSRHQSVANYPTVDPAILKEMAQALADLFGLRLPVSLKGLGSFWKPGLVNSRREEETSRIHKPWRRDSAIYTQPLIHAKIAEKDHKCKKARSKKI
jgi:hypothetical protein